MDIQSYIQSGAIESYVLGMADAQEAAELQQLMLQHAEVRQAVQDFEASLEKAAMAGAIVPASEDKDKLMAMLAVDFASTENIAKVVALKNNASSNSFIRYAAAAAIILLIASSALNVYFYKQYKDTSEKYTALWNEKNTVVAQNNIYQTKMLDMYNSMQMMSDPMMKKVMMPGVKGKENDMATVFWDTRTKDVYLLANKLPQAPEDKQYQLWAIVDGKPVDAGMLEDCNGLCKLKNIPNAQMFAITLENKGGSPTPTMEQMYVAGKVS